MECYLDNSATTRCLDSAAALMAGILCTDYGNPSSLHHKGVQAEEYVRHAREVIAKTLKVTPKEIFFTSGGTESDNLALRGAAYANARQGKHLITTSIEHPAILNTMQYLEQQGFEVTYLPVDENGKIRLSDLEAAIRPDTILISVMFGNNEVGTIEPVMQIGRFARDHQILFHTDAVQAYAQIPISMQQYHIDLLSASAHKFHGPKGVGFLYVRDGVTMPSFIHGGSQERGKRAGTENVPGIVGMGKAVELAFCNMRRRIRREMMLRNYLIEKIMHEIKGVRLNGHPTNRLPGNVNVSFSGVDGASLLILLYEDGICASGGSACNTGEERVSYVIGALGVPDEYAAGTVRMTLSGETTRKEIDRAVEALKQNLRKLRDEK